MEPHTLINISEKGVMMLGATEKVTNFKIFLVLMKFTLRVPGTKNEVLEEKKIKGKILKVLEMETRKGQDIKDLGSLILILQKPERRENA